MISVIIPSYRNKLLLMKNLKINLEFLNDCEVVIVNDYPQESLKNDLSKFKNITLLENKKNLGFGATVNQGVGKAKGDYILLLNSDVILSDSSYKKAIEHFRKNKNLFAVSFAQMEKNGNLVGKNKIFWKNGIFQHSKADGLDHGINGWAEGGSCLIDKSKFLKLGGFDKIYQPFYWEDIDLSYRAWKAGYQIIFEPSVVVDHHHESTIGRYFDKKNIKNIAFRNQFLFIWKNITDLNLLVSHFLFLLPNLFYFLLKDEPLFLTGFITALKKIPEILKSRKTQKKLFILSDKKVLSIFNE